jgi:hypothetical protein
MRPFLRGFVDEIVKLAAFPQSHEEAPPYDAGVASILDRAQGGSAKTGLKGGAPMPPPAQPKRAPTPLTTPNHMVDYASKADGGG